MTAVLHRVYRGAAGLVLLFGVAQLALWASRVSPATFPLPSVVLGSAAETFTDMMDTARSARLELLIVILIVAELIIGAATLFR